MARSALLTLASMGLSAGVLVVSFLGCGSLYEDVSGGNGNCVDDNNPCTIDSCTTPGGATVHTPAKDGGNCALGDNTGKCGNGRCVLDCETNPASCKCEMDAQCPPAETCATWSCVNMQCIRSAANEGNLVTDQQTAEDCNKVICQGGEIVKVADDMDLAMDPKEDCQKPTCNNGIAGTENDANDPPPDTKGDCQKPVCANGMPANSPDNADEPPDTGCINNICVAGVPTPMQFPVGTGCNPPTNDVCDSSGACVDCLSLGDWVMCGSLACKVGKCNGEPAAVVKECKSNAVADGVCCNTACTEECKSCAVDGSKGTCSNTPLFGPDDYQFNGTAVKCDTTQGFECDGKGACKLRGGVNCNNDPTSCASGECMMTCKWLLNEPCSKPQDCLPTLSCKNGTCQMP